MIDEPYRYITGAAVPFPEGGATLPPFHFPWCFGCGPENDAALGVVPRVEGAKVVADLSFAPRFHGGPGLVHGGAISALMDDLLGFVPFAHGYPSVTAKLEVNYRTHIPLGTTVRGEAWLTAIQGRKLWVEGAAEDATTRYMEARGLFLLIDAGHFARELEHISPAEREYMSGVEWGQYP